MFASLVIPWWRYWSLGRARGKSRDVSFLWGPGQQQPRPQQEQNHHPEGQGQPERQINNYSSNDID